MNKESIFQNRFGIFLIWLEERFRRVSLSHSRITHCLCFLSSIMDAIHIFVLCLFLFGFLSYLTILTFCVAHILLSGNQQNDELLFQQLPLSLFLLQDILAKNTGISWVCDSWCNIFPLVWYFPGIMVFSFWITDTKIPNSPWSVFSILSQMYCLTFSLTFCFLCTS